MGVPPTPPRPRSEARSWSSRAVDRCVQAWTRLGRRYARRLDVTDRMRDASGDVLTLAARREVPQAWSSEPLLLRPLPEAGHDVLAGAFNRLEPADRYVLRRLDELRPRTGVRNDHLASALERLAGALDSASRAAPATKQAAARPGPRPG